MKFAKQLYAERIPEYADFYLDYKLGKKKVKALQAAKRRTALQSTSSSRWRAVQAGQDVNDFMNEELHKVEKFYGEKEQAAIDRMLELKLQFNIFQEQLFLRQSAAAVYAPQDPHRDYVQPNVHRNYARRKLKSALIEFYRGLDLLRSFVRLNSTAFRKLNKKFDKATGDRPLLWFYSKNVEHAHFVQSNAIDQIGDEVEELFARHFERGNRKAAIDELKTRNAQNWKTLSSAMFADGIFLGLGSTLGVVGLINGISGSFEHHGDTPEQSARVAQTDLLLQLYGGYFLIWLMAVVFCMACVIFDYYKINYSFIFQFNPAHNLNWRELLVIPLLFYFLLGLSLFLDFHEKLKHSPMHTYWFILLIGTTVATLLLPLPTLYHKSRAWFVKHIGRLALSSLYTVTFPDFFLGDLCCSLTYSFGNIGVFVALYGKTDAIPPNCKYWFPQLLGFFSAIPSIWRALQCLRRFRDSGAWMPHLPNFGKYCATCAAYSMLSTYRICKNSQIEALYITCAVINTIYCIFWDVKLDWSLANPRAGFLREDLSFKDHKWIYWFAIAEDILLRCNWVANIASSRYPGLSPTISFFVALSEVLRRAIWMIFRVENEHWGNVHLTQAYRDPPLPFKVALELEEEDPEPPSRASTASATAHDMDRPASRTHHVPINGGLRNRREPPIQMRRLASRRSILDDAHMHDYVRTESIHSDSSTSEEEEEG